MAIKVSAPVTWICPHCNFAQLVTPEKSSIKNTAIDIKDLAEGYVLLYHNAKGCVNPQCMKLTISAYLYPATRTYNLNGPDHFTRSGQPIAGMRFLPKGASRPQPDYIPKPLIIDYEEACAIRDLSPKASATLVRRCLQGMIRDFCGIAKNSLANEIKALKAAVDGDSAPKGVSSETVDAIDHVRSIGNIGAHMEKDINVIVDVDANEAQMLIELVEMLFDEWYVARHKRIERLQAITALSSQKEEERTPPQLLLSEKAEDDQGVA